jgi:hypothetical protein
MTSILNKNVPGESCGKERIGFDKENIPPPPVRALEEKMSPTLERLKKRLKEFEDKASEARMITAIKSQLLDELKMPRKLDEDVRVPPFEHEYDDITPSSELSVNTGKIVLLTNRKLKKTEVGAMGRLFDVKKYIPRYQNTYISGISCDIFVVNIRKKRERIYYSKNLQDLSENPNITTTFVSKTGKPIDVQKIKKEYKCDHVVKYLPKRKDRIDDVGFFKAWLVSDHLTSVLNEATGCFGSILRVSRNLNGEGPPL